jgi:hypothetical protein
MPAYSRAVITPFDGIRRRLLVVERGASLLANQSAEAENFDETVTVAQMRDESCDDFSDRVVRRIGAAAQSAPFSEALLYVSDVCEPATLSARRLLAIAILAQAEATSGPAGLVVVASANASRAERERLLELTDDLVLGAQSTSLPVRLRFVAALAPAAPLNASEPVADPQQLFAAPHQLRPSRTKAERDRGRHRD